MNIFHTLFQVLSHDKLFGYILRMKGEIGRFEFFSLFMLRFTLLLFISQLIGQPFLIIVICAYFMYDLVNARMRDIGANRLLIIGVTVFITIYTYLALNTIHYLLLQYAPYIYGYPTDTKEEILEIYRTSKLILIINLVLAIAGIAALISFFFLLLKKGRIRNHPVISRNELFNGHSLGWHLFNFKGLSTRINYIYAQLFAQLIIVGIYLLILAILFILNDYSMKRVDLAVSNFVTANKSFVYLLLGLFVLYGMTTFFAITVKRLHHLGNNGNWVWLYFVLSIVFVLTHPIIQNLFVSMLLMNKGPLYYYALSNDVGWMIGIGASFFRLSYLLFMIYFAFYPGKVERQPIGSN